MTYNVSVATAGNYTVKYRVASLNGGGSLQLEQAGGGTVYGTLSVPATGGWQTWSTIQHTVNLPAGNQQLAIKANAGGWNLNYWGQATSSSSSSSSSSGGFTQTIQAESYSSMSGVQIETTSDAGGGSNVGYIDAGDWMGYPSVNIPTAGTYTIEYRVASQNGGGSLRFELLGGGTVYGTLAVPATGGWQTWTTIKHTITLTAGAKTFAIAVPTGGWNINWITITQGIKAATDNEIAFEGSQAFIYPNPASEWIQIETALEDYSMVIFDLQGKEQHRFENLSGQQSLNIGKLADGIYICRLNNPEITINQKLVVSREK
jgi:endoglucanase